MLRVFDDLVLSYNRPDCPEKYVSTLFGYFFHIYHGEITGATPNGRLRGEPFSDSMGPSQGKDVSGPTKLLNSALKQDFSTMTGGYALNVKINREHARGARGRAMLTGLVRTYFDQGGASCRSCSWTTRSCARRRKNRKNTRTWSSGSADTASISSISTGRCRTRSLNEPHIEEVRKHADNWCKDPWSRRCSHGDLRAAEARRA